MLTFFGEHRKLDKFVIFCKNVCMIATTFELPEPTNYFVELGRELLTDAEPQRALSEHDGTEYTIRTRKAIYDDGVIAIQQRLAADSKGRVTENIDLLWTPDLSAIGRFASMKVIATSTPEQEELLLLLRDDPMSTSLNTEGVIEMLQNAFDPEDL
jgi:hypothetical protein